jgi:hypothetical protein
MDYEQPPFLVRAIPDLELRKLAEYYDLPKLLDGKKQKGRYCDWIRSARQSFRSLLRYTPTAGQLQMLAVPALLQEDGFLGHLVSGGITDFSKDQDKVQKLAKAAAAIIVATCCDDTPTTTV